MGLLDKPADDTPPLAWEASKMHIQHVKTEGIQQFLHTYERNKNIRDAVLKWGDEVEYTLMVKDKSDGNYKLLANAPELLAQLEEAETHAASTAQVLWHPEYSNWQIEGTPKDPYRCYVTDLLLVEPNMRLRRSLVQKLLGPDQYCLSVTNIVMMGKPRFLAPSTPPGGPISLSNFIPDAAINPHPRFACLTGNIRRRRQEKVDIRMPLYEDTNTAATAEDAGVDLETGLANPSLASEIDMDCMAFGMGSCCLQVTLQARDVTEARILYDQLATLAPIMLALTAATPAWRGRIAATDVRWDVISQAVDDRTPGERGAADLQPGEQRLAKSRYASISRYIAPRQAMGAATEATPEPEPEPESESEAAAVAAVDSAAGPPAHLSEYNDVEAPIHQPSYDTLIAAGIDDVLAHHIAHLYVRDPLVVYESKLQQDAATEVDHFENIQSTNWQVCRRS